MPQRHSGIDLIQERVLHAMDMLQTIAQSQELMRKLEDAARLIGEAYRAERCAFFAGNGGSAADAQHVAAEFVSKLDKDRQPIRAFAMTVDTSILTAIGNDYGYEKCFSRQVKGLMRAGDVLVAFSTSGNSPNIVEALHACREKGCKSILFTGGSGGHCLKLADVAIVVPAQRTAHIQEGHVVLYHILCELVEDILIHANLCSYV